MNSTSFFWCIKSEKKKRLVKFQYQKWGEKVGGLVAPAIYPHKHGNRKIPGFKLGKKNGRKQVIGGPSKEHLYTRVKKKKKKKKKGRRQGKMPDWHFPCHHLGKPVKSFFCWENFPGERIYSA